MMVRVPISKSKGMGLSPGREYSVVFLGKTLQSINQSVNQPYLPSIFTEQHPIANIFEPTTFYN